jgi:hypothetical protein
MATRKFFCFKGTTDQDCILLHSYKRRNEEEIEKESKGKVYGTEEHHLKGIVAKE